MMNLTTQESKKVILKEYRFRLFIVSVLALASIMAAGVVLLIPSFILTELKHSSVTQSLNDLKKQNAAIGEVRSKEIDATIKEVNRKAILILKGTGGERLVPSETVALVLAKRPAGIRIDSLLFDVTADRERLVVTGVARNRATLANYADMLKAEKTFTKVDLPISSFVKNTNIDLTISLERALVIPKKKK